MVANKRLLGKKVMLLAGVLTSSILVLKVDGQAPATTAPATTPASAAATATTTAEKPAAAPAAHSPYHPNRFSRRAELNYELVWGVDSLNVKWVESGEVIRFAYRVLDPVKAKIINDKKYEPSLIDPAKGIRLVVPTLEKVGQLRQAGTPTGGTSYWMAFSNKGRLVKKGDRVDVVIGQFRADGLVVD